jgi:hypothetical protein
VRQMIQFQRNQSGLSSTVGLVAMAVSLLLVAVILVFSLNGFGLGSGAGMGAGAGAAGGSASGTPSILSHSSAEHQIQLCSEGRDSTYGDPPSAAQQATCIHELLGGISGVAPSVPGTP